MIGSFHISCSERIQVSNMATLAGDSRMHVAVSAFKFARDLRPRLSALSTRRSTFADRHLFIQPFHLQGSSSLDLTWRYISQADLHFPYTS